MTPLETLAQLGPIATGLAATVALAVGLTTVRQRDRADRRDQWWKRAQWALDQAWADDAEGLDQRYALLSYLAASSLAGPDEHAMLEALEEPGLNPDAPPDETGRDTVTGGPERDVR